MLTYLVIVSRGRPDLYAYIRRAFFADTRYRIIFDRRRIVRRRGGPRGEFDRRRGDRRGRPEAEDELRIQGWAVVPVVEAAGAAGEASAG